MEDAGVDEVAEGLVVEVVAGEFSVLGHHVDDNLEEVFIALDLGGVAVGVVDGVDEGFALCKEIRELLYLGTNCVGVFPLDATVEGVEVFDDVREDIQLGFFLTSLGAHRDRGNLGVFVGERDVDLLLLDDAVFVEVDGFNEAFCPVIDSQLGQLGAQVVVEVVEFLPFYTAEGHHGRQERIGADIALDGALALDLLVLREFRFEALYAAVDDGVKLLTGN